MTPGGKSAWDSRFLCGEDNTIEAYIDTCNLSIGACVPDHVRPGHDDAFCENQ